MNLKVLHITEEISEKNYSISYLIFFIFNFLSKKNNIKYNVLTTLTNKGLFKNEKKLIIFETKNLTNFFNNLNFLKDLIKKYDVIHVHGLWRLINFVSIFFAFKNNIPVILHPHGMLLTAALKNKGSLNFFLKKLFLKIINKLFGNNLIFFSITDLESDSIKKFFINSNIIHIPNPILVKNEQNNALKHKLKKKIVFFGRIHPIKNIDKLIVGFKNSNLDKNWSLEIYGIEDDIEYHKKLKKLILGCKNIKIKKPVYDNRKKKILSSAWLNILLSNSEVLSLSVLESGNYQLPSLVNKDIQIKNFIKNGGVTTTLNIRDISKNINKITNWSYDKRVQRGKKLQKYFSKIYDINYIHKKYISTDNKIFHKKNIYQNKSNSNRYFNLIDLFIDNNFFQISLSYVFNLMIPTLMMLMLTISSKNNIAADIGIVSSLMITITQIFSSNARSLIIAGQVKDIVEKNFLFRCFISFFLLIIFVTLNIKFNYNFENSITIFLFVLVVLCQWLHELVLANNETRSKIFYFISYNLLNLIICISYAISIFIFFEYFIFFIFIHVVYLAYLIIIFANKIQIKQNLNNLFLNVFLNLKSLAFFSSFSTTLSSFFWRINIYNFFDKTTASILFASFAIGSFPGTGFNLAIGPIYVKSKLTLSNNLKKILKSFWVFILIICVLNVFSLYNKKFDYFFFKDNLFYFSLCFSILGSFFMTYSMYIRQKTLQLNITNSKKIFRIDIIYGLIISALCPLLYYYGGIYLISVLFLLGSLTSYIFYNYLIRNYK